MCPLCDRSFIYVTHLHIKVPFVLFVGRMEECDETTWLEVSDECGAGIRTVEVLNLEKTKKVEAYSIYPFVDYKLEVATSEEQRGNYYKIYMRPHQHDDDERCTADHRKRRREPRFYFQTPARRREYITAGYQKTFYNPPDDVITFSIDSSRVDCEFCNTLWLWTCIEEDCDDDHKEEYTYHFITPFVLRWPK